MEDDLLFDALSGLYAYSVGATDSGIRDEALKARINTYLHTPQGERALLRYIQKKYTTEGSLYATFEELRDFVRWVDDEMDLWH